MSIASSILTAVLLLSVPIGVVLVLIVYFIYKNLYTKHANKALQEGSGVKRKKWLPPFAVVLITICIEVVLAIGIVVGAVLLFRFNTSSSATRTIVGNNTLNVMKNEDGYEVTSLTGKVEIKSFSSDYFDAVAYFDDNQIFVTVDIIDSDKVDHFIVHEDDAETEVLYKNADDEYLETVPIELERQSEDEVVTIDVCFSDGSFETIKILGN